MSFAPGWRGTNVIMNEFELKTGNRGKLNSKIMKSPKPYSKGRIVMYVPAEGETFSGNNTSPLAATIVQTWEETSYQNDEVNLKVHTDAPADAWVTSVPYSDAKAPRSWHWPEIK